MNEIIIKNIEEFINFLNSHNKLDSFIDIAKAHVNSFGGCNCNKKKRQDYANYLYENLKNNSNYLTELFDLKNELKINTIILENNGKLLVKI